MAIADILFVAADRREFTGAMRFWDDIQPIALPVHWARRAIRKGRPVVAVANGAGWERARLAAASVPHARLCSVGFCGAVDPGLKIADIVVSSQHLPVQAANHPHVTGPIASSSLIVATVQAKRQLWAAGYLAVEMEAAGIPVPFYCIKAVSDLANETFSNDFAAALLPDGRISTVRLLTKAFARPWSRVPELILLARRTADASKNLGEFLNDCDF